MNTFLYVTLGIYIGLIISIAMSLVYIYMELNGLRKLIKEALELYRYILKQRRFQRRIR